MDSRGEPATANDIEEDDFALLKIVAAATLTPSPAVPARLGGAAADRPAGGGHGAALRALRVRDQRQGTWT